MFRRVRILRKATVTAAISACLLVWNLNFLDVFFKNTQISNSMKIRPVERSCSKAVGQMDRQTDRHGEAYNLFL